MNILFYCVALWLMLMADRKTVKCVGTRKWFQFPSCCDARCDRSCSCSWNLRWLLFLVFSLCLRFGSWSYFVFLSVLYISTTATNHTIVKCNKSRFFFISSKQETLNIQLLVSCMLLLFMITGNYNTKCVKMNMIIRWKWTMRDFKMFRTVERLYNSFIHQVKYKLENQKYKSEKWSFLPFDYSLFNPIEKYALMSARSENWREYNLKYIPKPRSTSQLCNDEKRILCVRWFWWQEVCSHRSNLNNHKVRCELSSGDSWFVK